jgi:hypothetical protein
MAGLILELDPTAEATGSPLLLTDTANGWVLLEFDAPSPAQDLGYTSSVDTEGEFPVTRRYTNRTVTATLRILKTTDAALRTALDTLSGKVGKLQAQGGTLKLTHPSGDTRVFDVLAADYGYRFDKRYVSNKLAEVSLTLPAWPIARGADTTQADRAETTLPVLIATETGILGDVKATGQLVIDNDNGSQEWWGVAWGLEESGAYTFTDSTGSGALFYQAESRTALGGSATAIGPSGASGAGSNVMRNTALTTNYLAILSTQATGGGAHLTHVGTFRVYARVQAPATNTGTVSVAFEWSQGDFRRVVRNDPRTLDPLWEGTWRRLDLGLVNLSAPATGAMRWEGRVLATSTVPGDDIDVDWLLLLPADDGFGIAEGVISTQAPTAFTVRDEFDQTAGALSGKTLPSGGTWSLSTHSGVADDLAVDGFGRANNSGNTIGARSAIAGTTSFTDMVAQVDINIPAEAPLGGIVTGLAARWVSASVSMAAYIHWGGNFLWAGTSTGSEFGRVPVSVVAGDTWSLRLYTDALGRYAIWMFPAGGVTGSPIINGQSAELATGGTLASGRVGIFDGVDAVATGTTRYYDNFWAAVPVRDAAVFAGQSLQLRGDGVIREDSSGTFWQIPSRYMGSYLKVPVAGAEGRTCRYAITPLYHPPEVDGVWLDDRIDDLSARLTYTSRFLT